MAFVYHQQRVRRQVVVQGRRRFARFASGEVARVVFDAGAVAEFDHHFEVEAGALFEALRFYQFVLCGQCGDALAQFGLDLFDGV